MDYDDNTDYIVELARAIKVGHSWIKPAHKITIKGSFLKELMADPVASVSVNVVKAAG